MGSNLLVRTEYKARSLKTVPRVYAEAENLLSSSQKRKKDIMRTRFHRHKVSIAQIG